MSIYLAYAMIAYVSGCIYYFIRTRYIGTPFNDSLTPTQRVVKKQSANTRRNIFYQGMGLSIIILYLFKPFKPCNCKC